MNILIPHRWLLDHLDTQADPQTIRQNLSLCGPSVERLHRILDDDVYEIEVTTNRVDAMSIRGIAREAAAILPEFHLPARLKPLKQTHLLKQIMSASLAPLDIAITNDPKLSHRILAIKLTNLKIGPSPQWLQDRLLQVGQRPLNNAIDITNYVMWELGHPVHVFDYDRISQKKILVRQAKKGEVLITLDHKTHTLRGGEVVFDDGTGTIIDLPGIMGTENTVVSDKTTNVLLWIESVDPVKIRQASMGLAIRSQAAILNEKGVDPNLALDAIVRGVELFTTLTQATLGSRLTDIYPHPAKSAAIRLPHGQITSYLGVNLDPSKVVRILQNLQCQVKTITQKNSSYTVYSVTPPSFRSQDLMIYQDLIEEIARIYGYHHLPSVVMPTPIPDTPSSENFDLEQTLKTILVGFGANEIYTYSMVGPTLASLSGYTLTDHLKIKNPLTDDFIYLRRSLIPSLLTVFSDNPGQTITAFEMQNVFHPTTNPSDLPVEQLQLALVSNRSFLHLKGLVDGLMQKIYLRPSITPQGSFDLDYLSSPVGCIKVGSTTLGHLGQTKQPGIFAAVIDLKSLQAVARLHPAYVPVYTSAPVIEDLTFAFPDQTYLGPVLDAITQLDPLIETVTLKDSFLPQNPGPIHHTFSLRYHHPTQPLSAKKIAPLRRRIVNFLAKKFSGRLIGSI